MPFEESVVRFTIRLSIWIGSECHVLKIGWFSRSASVSHLVTARWPSCHSCVARFGCEARFLCGSFLWTYGSSLPALPGLIAVARVSLASHWSAPFSRWGLLLDCGFFMSHLGISTRIVKDQIWVWRRVRLSLGIPNFCTKFWRTFQGRSGKRTIVIEALLLASGNLSSTAWTSHEGRPSGHTRSFATAWRCQHWSQSFVKSIRQHRTVEMGSWCCRVRLTNLAKVSPLSASEHDWATLRSLMKTPLPHPQVHQPEILPLAPSGSLCVHETAGSAAGICVSLRCRWLKSVSWQNEGSELPQVAVWRCPCDRTTHGQSSRSLALGVGGFPLCLGWGWAVVRWLG